ncbi:MAG: DUF2190 family protein [Kiritimatiellae bacterium]|nr:DUF2190 family protein [Kiritimatiellia bacterium]
MDARYVQRGDAIDHTPIADVAAGDIVIQSKLVGVAKLDIKAGELGALALAGVYEVAKATGTAFAVGMEVGWNPTTKQAVAAGAAGSTKIGHAVALAGAGDSLVYVRLCQGLA